ncbi:MAG: hypothetical protein IT585_09930 [candidate division Zixibacteria bacterium]|nr:hypothetical protein [candidate division Zixibacteria bacterium]
MLKTVTDFSAGRRLVAILNSRQSKRPCGSDDWVKATTRAVEMLLSEGVVFLTSTGLSTWELAVHLVNTRGGSQVIVFDPGIDPDTIVKSFQLDRSRCSLVQSGPTAERDSTSTAHYRDEAIAWLADQLIPISVRSGGFLEEVIKKSCCAGKAVDTRFRVPYCAGFDRPDYDFQSQRLNSALDGEHWTLLTHWTRSHHGPLPEETAFEFYHDLLTRERYPRSALDILLMILRSGRIRGSSRFIRGGFPVVSLTARTPQEAVQLMRWRRRYTYYNFEPYGIAIGRGATQALSCRPAIYGSDELYERLAPSERPFFQKAGSTVADWTPEAEWRVIGELRLTELPPEEVRVIVYRQQEIAAIEDTCAFRVDAMTI